MSSKRPPRTAIQAVEAPQHRPAVTKAAEKWLEVPAREFKHAAFQLTQIDVPADKPKPSPSRHGDVCRSSCAVGVSRLKLIAGSKISVFVPQGWSGGPHVMCGSRMSLVFRARGERDEYSCPVCVTTKLGFDRRVRWQRRFESARPFQSGTICAQSTS